MVSNKDIPVLYKSKEYCCCCTACFSVCPRNAISMVEDETGLKYPVIDESVCIRCNLCVRSCPVQEKMKG